jgi:hypothetical protein
MSIATIIEPFGIHSGEPRDVPKPVRHASPAYSCDTDTWHPSRASEDSPVGFENSVRVVVAVMLLPCIR